MALTLVLPGPQRRQLEAELARAGRREIGGILMGRDFGNGVFRIEEVQVQRHGGGLAFFLRQVNSFVPQLKNFFDRTGHRYTEYNYLGEWHSHPSFVLIPSQCDQESMREIVDDPDVGATFAILLIAKLGPEKRLLARAYSFVSDQPHTEVTLQLEGNEQATDLHR